MRRLLALAILVALAGCSDIVEPSLVVTVTAPQEGRVGPVEGAIVLLSDKIHGGATDGDGQVRMYGLGPGLYNVTVDWQQQKQLQPVRIGNETVHLLFRLNETAVPDILVHVRWRACPACDPAPAKGAVVLLSDNIHGGQTGAQGTYGFFALDRGAYNVTVAYDGRQMTQGAVVSRVPSTLVFHF